MFCYLCVGKIVKTNCDFSVCRFRFLCTFAWEILLIIENNFPLAPIFRHQKDELFVHYHHSHL